MSTCSVSDGKADFDLAAACGKWAGAPDAPLERLGGGRNSRVFAVQCPDGQRRVLKQYARREHGRDAQQTEFTALELLRDNGSDRVPRVLAMDGDLRCTWMEHIPGLAGPPDAYANADVDQAAEFVDHLWELSLTQPLFEDPASEAGLCGADVLAHIDRRIERLSGATAAAGDPSDIQALYGELDRFLTNELLPARRVLEAELRGLGMLEASLSPALRVLSPSDLGWHNGVLRPDGRWIFVDFEHFGWDDPVKLVADFTLHPALSCPADLMARFVEHCRQLFQAADSGFSQRLARMRPLYVLKWCTILLNEFLPDHAARRKFAASEPLSWSDALAAQLSKARRMMSRVGESLDQERVRR